MTYTKTKPTEEGWYPYRSPDGGFPEVVFIVTRFLAPSGDFVVMRIGYGTRPLDKVPGLWGPRIELEE